MTQTTDTERPSFLSEGEWSKLIRNIYNGQVIPIVGPELVTLSDPESGKDITLQQFLAPRLAKRLDMAQTGYEAVNDVVRDYLMSGGDRQSVYTEAGLEMDDFCAPPAEALLALSKITGFSFFISSTFDGQLSHALEENRIDYDPKTRKTCFHPTDPRDVSDGDSGTHLFHILGDFQTYPDFALWEEDHMEFVCGLLENRDNLSGLFTLLKKRHLLFLGVPASDWIVRFLLRAARQERLSTRSGAVSEYLTDHETTMGDPMILFFDKMIQASHVVRGGPAEFVAELSERWNAKHGDKTVSDGEFLRRMSETMPQNSIFISYASEDRDAAIAIAKGLDQAGAAVWLDKGRLSIGQNYETELEGAVRAQSSFFISLISETTEADTERTRYVHKERDWAAQRHMEGYVYYIPVVISPTVERGTCEPEVFQKIHHDTLPGGKITKAFANQLRQWQESYRASGQPRR